MHIVRLMDGQILKSRAAARLVREDQFNVEELKNFKVATHESNARCEPAESDSQVIHSSALLPESEASSAEGATSASAARPSESTDNRCSDSTSSRTTSAATNQKSEEESPESSPI